MSLVFAVLSKLGLSRNYLIWTLEQAEKRLVIEGRLVDEHSIQKIKIAESLNYYDTVGLSPFKKMGNVSLIGSGNSKLSSRC